MTSVNKLLFNVTLKDLSRFEKTFDFCPSDDANETQEDKISSQTQNASFNKKRGIKICSALQTKFLSLI